MHSATSFLRRVVIVSAALLFSFTATQSWGGYERGPVPTEEGLEATGPYQLDSHVISRFQASSFGYGGATIYYPRATNGETFGIVTLMTGYTAPASIYTPVLARRFASHGFIVINVTPNTVFDWPNLRARQMTGALKHALQLAESGKAPYTKVLDGSRRAMTGLSMGGGGTLVAAESDPTLKAAVGLVPWYTGTNFLNLQVPTLLVSAENDMFGNDRHANAFYATFPATTPRGLMEVKGAGHLSMFLNGGYEATMAKCTIAWLKRFVDEDMRYDAFIKNDIDRSDFTRFETAGF